jgi:hypothetical protein
LVIFGKMQTIESYQTRKILASLIAVILLGSLVFTSAFADKGSDKPRKVDPPKDDKKGKDKDRKDKDDSRHHCEDEEQKKYKHHCDED